MIQVITLDDEQLALDNLNYILKKFEEIEVVLSTTSPAEVLDSLERLKPDLIFADISMPEINGMEIAERIMEQQLSAKIIFITAYEQYALDAFRVNAIDYILKPVTTSKIQHALNRLHLLDPGTVPEKNTSAGEFRIIANQNGQFYIIRPEEGQYIKMVLRELILVTQSGEYLLRHSIAYWESNLSPYGWFRCHKGYLINLNQIDAIYPMFNSTYNIRVKGQKEEIPVSRTYLKAFRNLLNI